MLVFVKRAFLLLSACTLTASLPWLAGCRSAASALSPDQTKMLQQNIAVAREDLEQIPPPSKNLYMNVHTLDGWENPLLTVQQNMITVTVIMPDANPSNLGKGTILRPAAARKNVLNIDPNHLAEALNAVPHEAWPYGRVVAIEEAHDAPAAVRPQLRRTMEQAMQTLSDIGVVSDEWNDQKPLGLR